MILIIIIIILIVVFFFCFFLFIINNYNKPKNINQNKNEIGIEELLLIKLQNEDFKNKFYADPKKTLEEEISAYSGTSFKFNDKVNVKILSSDPNDLYILLPNNEKQTNEIKPLEQILPFIGSRTYGLFMGIINNIWVRFGLFEGYCKNDELNELQKVINQAHLSNC